MEPDPSSLSGKVAFVTGVEITDAGGEALAVAGDVSSVQDLAAAVKQIEQQWGRLDIIVANAGVNFGRHWMSSPSLNGSKRSISI